MNNKQLAAQLARSIFTAPTTDKTKVTRIAFKAERRGTELDLGGFSEQALAEHIQTALDDLFGGWCCEKREKKASRRNDGA